MLDCVLCRSRNLVVVDVSQMEQLQSTGATQLLCDVCNRVTAWVLADCSRRTGGERREKSGPAPAIAALACPPPPQLTDENRRSGVERRQASQRRSERVRLSLPIRIRVSTINLEINEVTTTINVSRGGVYFQSNKPYTKNLQVRATLNYNPKNEGAGIEQLAIVVRVDTDPKTAMKGVALKYIEGSTKAATFGRWNPGAF